MDQFKTALWIYFWSCATTYRRSRWSIVRDCLDERGNLTLHDLEGCHLTGITELENSFERRDPSLFEPLTEYVPFHTSKALYLFPCSEICGGYKTRRQMCKERFPLEHSAGRTRCTKLFQGLRYPLLPLSWLFFHFVWEFLIRSNTQPLVALRTVTRMCSECNHRLFFLAMGTGTL